MNCLSNDRTDRDFVLDPRIGHVLRIDSMKTIGNTGGLEVVKDYKSPVKVF